MLVDLLESVGISSLFTVGSFNRPRAFSTTRKYNLFSCRSCKTPEWVHGFGYEALWRVNPVVIKVLYIFESEVPLDAGRRRVGPWTSIFEEIFTVNVSMTSPDIQNYNLIFGELWSNCEHLGQRLGFWDAAKFSLRIFTKSSPIFNALVKIWRKKRMHVNLLCLENDLIIYLQICKFFFWFLKPR